MANIDNLNVAPSPAWRGMGYPPSIAGTADESESIRAAILHIITTPLGSRVDRPDFGCPLWDLIDQPITPKTKARMIAGTIRAVRFWEPRVSVKGVRFGHDAAYPERVVIGMTVVEIVTGVETTIEYVYDREVRRWVR